MKFFVFNSFNFWFDSNFWKFSCFFSRFSLQFLTSNPSNVFFAFTPHLERKIIDLNSRHEGDWEETTSVSNFFPFVEGQPFQVKHLVFYVCAQVKLQVVVHVLTHGLRREFDFKSLAKGFTGFSAFSRSKRTKELNSFHIQYIYIFFDDALVGLL